MRPHSLPLIVDLQGVDLSFRGIACIEIEYAEMFTRAFPGRRPGRRTGQPGDHERLERPNTGRRSI